MMIKHNDQFIFGIHAVNEALDAGKELEKVLLKSGRVSSEAFNALRRRLSQERIPFQHVPLEKLNSVTRKNHQGVVAYVSEISYSEIEFILPEIFQKGEVPLILVLDGISDVRNFGAIARTAECAGVHAIVIPFKGGARITAEAIKTSAGSLHKIPVCRHAGLREVLQYLKESGLKIIAASEKADQTLFQTQLVDPLVIIMGSEDHGVSSDLLKMVDEVVAIPQAGSISSLNVSVAAGILIYEAIRQRSN